MPDTENPRSHIQPVPLPIPSNQDLQITAGNAKFHTCEVPTRKEVARENYERRKHQMSKCSYRSVIYKPYQPVEDVFLDDRKLILSALGQEQTEQNNQAYLGEKPCPLGRHIHIWLVQGSTRPRGHIVLPASYTCHLLYFLCCLLYLDVVSSFLLTSYCLLITSKHQLFTADYVSFILY